MFLSYEHGQPISLIGRRRLAREIAHFDGRQLDDVAGLLLGDNPGNKIRQLDRQRAGFCE